MLDFKPTPGAAPAGGMILRIGETEPRYLRVTHLFGGTVFVMFVGEPEKARYARRPFRKSLSDIQKLAANPGSMWGRISLPAALSDVPPEGSERARSLESAWDLIRPLVQLFGKEENLARNRFTALIRQHANLKGVSFISLQRLLLRYYYFGGTRLALLTLPRGSKPASNTYFAISAQSQIEQLSQKRRGRQPAMADELGVNDFVVSEEDIGDMVECLKTCLRKGPTTITNAHEEYLAGWFRRRHPRIYSEYMSRKRLEPVTKRQFTYYTDQFARLSEELAVNLRTKERNPGYLGSVSAMGPGEVYEIDSTGGRLYLVSTDDPPVAVGKPTIYLIIDRWSRFVVSVYLSLRPPSYEEVRHALLVAFTSREQRFRAIGVDIDNERWPVGRMPAVLCPDRGTEYMGNAMEHSIVGDLRIELTPLPPFCPDGKAIVERFIREIKRRMVASGMKGVYADRPLDPQSKRAARKAEEAAVHSLAEAYRRLIEVIDDHNNRPHSTLRRRRVLTQAGVPPTPKNAYLWGLQHITGLRTAPLSDDDYHRLLLNVDTASVAKGYLKYKQRLYSPANEAAFDIAARSTTRPRQTSIRVDKTYPVEVFVPNSRAEWAKFQLTSGGVSELAGMSLDEEDAFASRGNLLWAKSEYESRIDRVAAKASKAKQNRKASEPAIKVAKQQQTEVRMQETADLKRALLDGRTTAHSDSSHDEPPLTKDWARIEEEERLRNLEQIRKHRSKN